MRISDWSSDVCSSDLASEAGRPDVKAARREWRERRQPFMRRQPERLVFADETSVKTTMTPLRGRTLRGAALLADPPFAKWRPHTLLSGLRTAGLTAPCTIEWAVAGPAFHPYVPHPPPPP